MPDSGQPVQATSADQREERVLHEGAALMSVSASLAALSRPDQAAVAPHVLATWARHHPALEAASIEELIHRAQGHPRPGDTHPASSDEVYNALITEHLAGDRT